MIRHIVFFTAPAEKLDEVRNGLSLLTEIQHALTFEIGTNIKRDLYANEVDLVVYGEFENLAAFDAFKAHPLYQAAILRRRIRRKTQSLECLGLENLELAALDRASCRLALGCSLTGIDRFC